MAALYAVWFVNVRLGVDPYIAILILAPAFFAIGYGLQRFVIDPVSHGERPADPSRDARRLDRHR